MFLIITVISFKSSGVVLVVLIVVYDGSQIASTLVATATADPNQRRLMLVLPFVFVVFLYRFPAGLLVYWITTNLWTIGQQLAIRRYMGGPAGPPGKPAPGASTDGKAAGPRGGEMKGEPALAGVGSGRAGATEPRQA